MVKEFKCSHICLARFLDSVAYHHTLGPLWPLDALWSIVSGGPLEQQQCHLRKHVQGTAFSFSFFVES